MNVNASINADPRAALIDGLKQVRAGMLGVEGSGQHLQPMTHYADWDLNCLWFLTSKDTDLVRALTPGARAQFVVMDEKHGFDACLAGRLTEDLDRVKLDEYWSAASGAWFHGGKSDPLLTMLRLDLVDASLWGYDDGALKFGFEILKANLDEDKTPDLGTHRVITF